MHNFEIFPYTDRNTMAELGAKKGQNLTQNTLYGIILTLAMTTCRVFWIGGIQIMLASDVGKVRNVVRKHIGSKVVVRCNLGRHKVDVTEGIISETYPSIFLIKVRNEIEDTFQVISYSYTDVLTKDVRITLCPE